MEIAELGLGDTGYPAPLANIHTPPKVLYYLGEPPHKLMPMPRLAIVGTRRISAYGKRVTIKLATALAEQGIVIISGLAYGVDIQAHKSALEAHGKCIAVLPSPLDNILPVENRRIANEILDNGGTLISEYESGHDIFKDNFVARNRIVSGLSEAVLIVEAGEKSGALHTAAFARAQNRDILVVPGDIDRIGSFGTNRLLKNGAGLITSYDDVLFALGLVNHTTPARMVKGRNPEEQTILDLILSGVNEGEKLQQQSGLDIARFSQTLTMLEISGKIRPLGGNQWAIS